MFQYASGLMLANRAGAELILDKRGGFLRDKVYQRSYELDKFTLRNPDASIVDRVIFRAEDILQRIFSVRNSLRKRPWGLLLKENEKPGLDLVTESSWKNLYLDGYFQSEDYFKAEVEAVVEAFRSKERLREPYRSLAERVASEDAVAVGIRVFEEVPGQRAKHTPFSFFDQTAVEFSKEQGSSTFYVFSTSSKLVKTKISLPGETVHISPDEGFSDSFQTWLLMKSFRRFIISHSSFYWWAAWLSEQRDPSVRIRAGELVYGYFPERWTKF